MRELYYLTVLVMLQSAALAQTPSVPATTFTTTYGCGTTVVQRATNPPAGEAWYWQTTASGTSTALGSSASISRTSSGSLYLRARRTSSPLNWSSTSQPVGTVTVYTVAPAAPASSTDASCFNGGSATLSVAAVAGATSYQWYQQSSGGTHQSGVTGNTYSPYGTSTITYYVSALSGGCESSTRRPVTLTIVPNPVITATNGTGTLNLGSSVTLQLTDSYASYSWRNALNAVVGTSATFTTGTPGSYHVLVTKAGVTGTGTSLAFMVRYGYENQSVNYVVSNTLQVPGVTDPAAVNPLTANENLQVIQYFDGLGRPVQTVTTQSSPDKKDLVQPVVYDRYGREHRTYLPVVFDENGRYKTGMLDGAGDYTGSAANTYDHNAAGRIAQDTRPFSETLFEPSPLNRPVRTYGPGEAWAPESGNRFTEKQYRVNTSSTDSSATAEKVIAWRVDETLVRPVRSSTASQYVVTGGYYATGTLTVHVSVDEEQHIVREYTDRQGRIVLKKVQARDNAAQNLNNASGWALTYYVYDDYGNLRFVLPPELSKVAHQSDTAVMNSARLAAWAFRYTYDERNRMVEKKVPGAGIVYMVYDTRDRLVATQDAVQRPNGYWTFTKYDSLNRPVLTGIKDTTASLSQANMQAGVNAHYAKAWARYGEGYSGNGPVHGYTNKSYPVVTTAAALDVNRYLTVTYYDTYDFKSLWTGSYSYVDENLSQTVNGVTYTQPDAEFTRVTGQVTGTKTKVLDGGVAGGYTWLKSVNYYDDDYRVIQTLSDNYKGATDRVTNLYDFTGKVLKTKSTHTQADLVWKDLVSATTIGNRLVSVGSPVGWGGSGAASVQQLGSGQDGWVEFTASAVGYNWMLGLSDQNTDANFTSLDYAWYLGTTSLTIRESGVARSFSGTYAPGDVLRIERTGTTIKYYQNGILRYTSAVPSSTILMVDVAMEANSNIVGVRSSFSTTSQITTRRFDYDHAGRLINTWHQLDSGPEILLVKNEYNELGQLIDKKLHSTQASGSDAKQSIDYRYNIRGWLTRLNESDLSIPQTGEACDLFGMQLGYNEDLGVSNTGLYNGNISAIKWSNNLSLGTVKENAYLYSYDPMNRLSASAFKEKSGTWTAAANSGYAETGFTYDLNGNIRTLQRNDRRASGWMDNLTYDYGSGSTQSNRLLKVTDAGDITKGFKDGNTSGNDYAYDVNGNLTTDKNKGISGSSGNVISYNYLNLPEKVQKSSTQLIRYIYDAAGRKLRQELSDGTTKKATDYAGEYIYENDTLQLINHEEGRIIPEGNEYQYHLKDHLGNVRMTFTSKHEADTAVATMETANVSEEQGEFIYYNEAVKVNSTLFDHTNSGATHYATRLTGTTNERFGLAKSISVMPGDTIRTRVFAKYLDTNNGNWTTALNNLMTAIANNTAPAGTVVDGGLTGSTGGVTPPLGSLLDKGDETGTAPKAYLNYLVFDRRDTLIDAGFVRISTAAREYGQDGAHEELFKEIAITEAGYVYLYLSNDNVALGGSVVEVFFDDFTVEHVKSPVIQQDDYYAFGLTLNSSQREKSIENNYLYNGKEKQKDLELGWYDYGWRQYDPFIARWMVVDPWAIKFKNWSPYNYGFNNPIRFADFMGLGPEEKTGPNGTSETLVYSQDQVGKDKTVTTVTQETRTRTTTENKDGTITTTVTRSVTTNTVTKDSESGEVSIQYGKTLTSSYSETTNSDGKVVSSTNPTTTESKKTSQNDNSMKVLNAWTEKVSNFNASHEKTFNQTIASQGRIAMTTAALSSTLLLPISGTTLVMGSGNRLLGVVASGPLGLGIAAGPIAGAAQGTMKDLHSSGGVYMHSASQNKIRDGKGFQTIPPKIPNR